MATYSQVKVAMADIAARLTKGRERMQGAKSVGADVSASLTAIQTDFADVITTINAYGTTNAGEALAKADLAKLTTEFTALKADADALAALNLND